MHKVLAYLSSHRLKVAACSLMLFIASGRLAVVANYGTDLPLQDSWAADTRGFIIPMGNDRFSPLTLFYPTNEHRVFFTNLSNATLAAVSGRWDNRMQAVFSALLCGVVLAGFWYGLAKRQPATWAAVFFALVAFVGGLPLVFENIVWGFQSQFLFVAGFSLYSIWQLLNARAGSFAWHTGWFAGLCAVVSFGSGFFAATAVLVVSLVRMFFEDTAGKRQFWLNLTAAILLLGVAWLLHNPTPHHEILHAKGPMQFLGYLLAGMAWPTAGILWVAPIIYAPLGWLAWRWLRQPEFRDALSTFLLGAGFWVALQIAAIAYTRANTTMWPPANRYGDLYDYGMLLNFAAGVVLLKQGRGARLAAQLLLCMIAGIFVFGAAQASRYALKQKLPAMRTEFRTYEENVRIYLRTQDRGQLSRVAIPYPTPYILANLLDMPAVQKYLPDSVRIPKEKEIPSGLEEVLGKSSSDASMLSLAAKQLAHGWTYMAGLGVALLLALMSTIRTTPKQS